MARKNKAEAMNFTDPDNNGEMEVLDVSEADNTDTEADAVEAAENFQGEPEPALGPDDPDDFGSVEDEVGEYSEEDYTPTEAMADHEAQASREGVYKRALNDIIKMTSGSLDHRFVAMNKVASKALLGG